MALVARSVGMMIVHLIFKTHTVGTDVFLGDCKMKFRKKEAWAMLGYSVVSGHSVRLMLLIIRAAPWEKEFIILVCSTTENIKATRRRSHAAGAPDLYVN